MNRSRDFYRNVRQKAINRKRYICKHVYWGGEYYREPGRYSKNKIHCSCWMCRHKSYDEANMQDKHSAIRDINKLEDISNNLYIDKSINKIKNRTKHLV